MTKLPEILKRLRRQKGAYLKEIAPLLGVTVGTASNYENGIHSPDPNILMQLADYYGVSVDYLIGHTDCPCPISDMNRMIFGKYTAGQFLELLDRLPERELPRLVHVLKLFELLRRSLKNIPDSGCSAPIHFFPGPGVLPGTGGFLFITQPL